MLKNLKSYPQESTVRVMLEDNSEVVAVEGVSLKC